jgi:hypothetical protein
MGCHVRSSRRLTSGSGSDYRGRVSDLSRRSVRAHSKGTHLPDPHLAAGEGPQTVDGLTRAGVTRSLYDLTDAYQSLTRRPSRRS